MPINKWRYVRYTDDGCSIYQCLACYRDWEGRVGPGYTDEEGYHPSWHFCPYCGTRWEGPVGCGHDERPENYGPRRARIELAIEKRREADRQAEHDQWAAGQGSYHDEPQPPFWWIVEERTKWFMVGGDIETVAWEPRIRMRGLTTSAKRALEILRERQQQLEIEHAPRVGDEDEAPTICQTRLVKMTPAEVKERHRGNTKPGYEVQR